LENIEVSDEGLIAREAFKPKLNEVYEGKYQTLLSKINNAYFEHRVDVINSEISKNERIVEKDFDLLKYLAVLNILKDLLQQGWSISVKDGAVELLLKQDKMSDKDRIRYRLNAERCAQFSTNAAKEFISRLEKKKPFNGDTISIRNLIGNANLLLDRINNQQRGVNILEPYIQLVTNGRDEHTGYKINDIWKYFRYTWSIPYKTMPGRNLFYLVRDASQPYHPVIGIFALGNTVLNLTVRDNDIGWTVSAIKAQMQRKTKVDNYKQIISQTNGKDVKVSNTFFIETEEEYQRRIIESSSKIIEALINNIDTAIKDIYVKDLPYRRQTKIPKHETIQELRSISESLRDKLMDNKKTKNVEDWEEEAKSDLFRKKRAQELANLLSAKLIISEARKTSSVDWLYELLKNEHGRTAIHTALIANRKNKIGSNMMEIIVCGAVPPYNELLGGKLVSILACSPRVISDYTRKYSKQVSEIASRMKGEKVIRDSHLVFLGTTSLYSIGSSQYNRIKVPRISGEGSRLEFKRMGITEGYGTVYFSKDTTKYMSKILEAIDGGKKINNVFGEGTSPRFRMISRGLAALEIKADAFLQHYSPRIVYSVELAENTMDFLMNLSSEVKYPFDINNEDSINQETERLVEFWFDRWLNKRITTIDINERLQAFNPESILLSNTKGV
jgi:hypothetical protein